ncbi:MULTISPECIES: hypothetical protein [unclassified Campylobacter]|uniref:hypothetical protein n=1 Tax=unclassified Campylobacter TaxID=2593542 RepID=UPI0022E9AFB1|nr:MULTISPECIES: hypothetical protein [unclassified Campylobacter]MDA3056162.1 hypothetical protein [Campylobacter sp. CN_NA1]MDA3065307.1 hypothetical protein [Campylobacter sp. CN_NE4]MDA3068133.1 hypothetical protein [Campylobacter sp. CN_NE3]MDA3082760.1 hypothetical protein [Campylobacter sp. CN_EL2]MDA3083501.1 hypothetical protein [Campylobacter sp. CN_NE1]
MQNQILEDEPKLIYRLDTRNWIYVPLELIGLGIPFMIAMLATFYGTDFITRCGGFLFALFFSHWLYYILLFDYIEIYEDRIEYESLLGIKQIIYKKDFLCTHCVSSAIGSAVSFYKHNRFYNKFVPYFMVTGLSIKKSTELENKVFEMRISKF